MGLEEMPLARQIDFVFRELEDELTHAMSGTVTIQIRNNTIGKFGIKHHPIECRNGELKKPEQSAGLTVPQVRAFRQMAVDALKMKRNWTHGEIMYDFSVRPNAGTWSASIQYESNYNSANWLFRYQPKNRGLRDTN
ncbi:O-methyltransferase [Paenibacillus sp. GCM10012307]|uniref:O-methyltransferase n=1 Tax=Paenibacillus roseus TaxID=2798579 RepID=A0A934J8I2_9BACL|nr:O-methyltransferase [Paenibacillus roseus]MBJ6362315.1 O-methyltransferase [Paenibacillus roseus]